MKLAWCTDIHLDFLDGPGRPNTIYQDFAKPLSDVDSDAVMITGDISLSSMLPRHLSDLEAVVRKPIYFVLGNHDIYGSSFGAVHDQVKNLCSSSKNLKYLTGSGPVSLTRKTALVGDDGWYDAYHGDASRSPYVMSDWVQIADYVNAGCAQSTGMYGPRPNMGSVIAISRKIAFDAAERMRAAASAASKSHKVVVILTHVPPWVQAHRLDGKSGSVVAHPWYTSKLMGDAIEEVAREHPSVRYEVFCGHTHGQYDAKIADNVSCHVGGAEYGKPDIVGTVLLE